MRIPAILLSLLFLTVADRRAESQESTPTGADTNVRVVLLGTAGGPTFNAQRLGISTLVEAGPETLLFDAGRGLTTAMAKLAINPANVTKVFLTHLHSDHVISLPELWLFAWAQGRTVPLHVWGPEGTRAMIGHLQEAFAFDVRTRGQLDEKFPASGVKIAATDIHEGVVYEANGVRVTAFLVDHGPVKPAFGYRVEYRGRSVVLSGDTRPTANLLKFATGADLLIHEVGRWKQDPALIGAPDERLPNSRQTRGEAKTIAAHHTDGVEAGRVFEAAKPKLAVFSHFNGDPQKILELVRQNYAGPVEFGEELMIIDVGSTVTVHRFVAPGR